MGEKRAVNKRTWTAKTPTQPGIYWRIPGVAPRGDSWVPRIVLIEESSGGGLVMDSWNGTVNRKLSEEEQSWRWVGPLLAPAQRWNKSG